MKKLTQEEVESRIKFLSDNKYILEGKYINKRTKITVFCREHNTRQEIKADNLFQGQKLKCCSRESYREKRGLSQKEIIEQFKEKHGDKYDYSLVEYSNIDTPVEIICNTCHKTFSQSPYEHRKGASCPYCQGFYKTEEEALKDIKRIRPEYDYSKVKYINSTTPMSIICHNHNEPFEFQLSYNEIMSGKRMCSRCANKLVFTEDFIEKATKIQGDLYDYSQVDYQGSKIKVKIFCKKHEKYFLQTPNAHLRGSGCPICKTSKGNKYIFNVLKENEINFINEYRFEDCIDERPLPFDFYLPDYNLVIEYDGIEHFEPVNFGSETVTLEKAFEYVHRHDKMKNEYCERNNIGIIRIGYKENLEERMKDILSLLKVF